MPCAAATSPSCSGTKGASISAWANSMYSDGTSPGGACGSASLVTVVHPGACSGWSSASSSSPSATRSSPSASGSNELTTRAGCAWLSDVFVAAPAPVASGMTGSSTYDSGTRPTGCPGGASRPRRTRSQPSGAGSGSTRTVSPSAAETSPSSSAIKSATILPSRGLTTYSVGTRPSAPLLLRANDQPSGVGMSNTVSSSPSANDSSAGSTASNGAIATPSQWADIDGGADSCA